jgi:hypothetical protein
MLYVMLLVLGILAGLNATLTLPGLAGVDPYHRRGGGRQHHLV